jgi:hypothetical protein
MRTVLSWPFNVAFACPGGYREFSVREHRLDAWKRQQAFLREDLLSPTGREAAH